MNTEQIVEDLERELLTLEEANLAEQRAERRTTGIAWAIALAIGAIVGGFLYANYRHFESEMTEERLAASLEREMDSLNDVALAELQTLGSNLLPVYAEEGRRQFDGLAPQLAEILERQISQLGADLQSDVRGLLSESEERIRLNMSHSVMAAFPSLTDPRQEAALYETLRRTTDYAVTQSIVDFDRRFSADTDELQEVIANFDVSDTDEPTVELQKRFVRSWLHLLDQEIERL